MTLQEPSVENFLPEKSYTYQDRKTFAFFYSKSVDKKNVHKKCHILSNSIDLKYSKIWHFFVFPRSFMVLIFFFFFEITPRVKNILTIQ